MALMPDGGVDREPVMHEVWNIWASSRGSARPPGLSYDPSQLDRSTALVSQDHNLCRWLGYKDRQWHEADLSLTSALLGSADLRTGPRTFEFML